MDDDWGYPHDLGNAHVLNETEMMRNADSTQEKHGKIAKMKANCHLFRMLSKHTRDLSGVWRFDLQKVDETGLVNNKEDRFATKRCVYARGIRGVYFMGMQKAIWFKDSVLPTPQSPTTNEMFQDFSHISSAISLSKTAISHGAPWGWLCQGGSIQSLVSELKASPEDADVQRSAARNLYDLCVGKDATALRHKQQAAEAWGAWGGWW